MVGIKNRKQLMKQFEPMADYGFLGPDSVSWKVWSHPTSYVLGFARAVTIEHFDPNLAAAVIQSGGVKYRPSTRYGRTLRYFAMQLFGGAEQTAKAADVLVKVHSKAVGNDPVTGGTYDANDPESQLWIHVTAWHSILKCYEMFGPGKLSEAEENQFWTEMREIAKLQTRDLPILVMGDFNTGPGFPGDKLKLAANQRHVYNTRLDHVFLIPSSTVDLRHVKHTLVRDINSDHDLAAITVEVRKLRPTSSTPKPNASTIGTRAVQRAHNQSLHGPRYGIGECMMRTRALYDAPAIGVSSSRSGPSP